MLRPRVIPSLLVKGSGLVKTRQFRDPKYVGDPNNAIKIFNDKSADELIVLDIEASRTGRGPNFALIGEFADECFMPVCYGGGIRSVEEASRIFELGVEKVSLQTSVLDDIGLISAIAGRYGSQAVVLSVDVKRARLGGDRVYASAAQKTTKKSWNEWMTAGVEAGAGEILLTCVDREGTMSGLDLDLVATAAREAPVPVIAHGGVGSVDHIRAGLAAGASAVAAGAFFVFQGPHRAVLITYLDETDFTSLGSTR